MVSSGQLLGILASEKEGIKMTLAKPKGPHLDGYLEEQGIKSYELVPLQRSNESSVFLLKADDRELVYKVRKTENTDKHANEGLALQVLAELLPEQSFYPHFIWARDREFLATYIPGQQRFPYELSESECESLASSLNNLITCQSVPFFTTSRLDQQHPGSALNITMGMITNYAGPKLAKLEIGQPSLARYLRQSTIQTLEDHQELLEATDRFQFFHYDLVNNIVTSEQQARLIDWEKSGYGDPAYNLAVLTKIGKCSRPQERILKSGIEAFTDEEFNRRYTFYQKLALVINFLWLHEKVVVDKVSPETIWGLEELESRVIEEVL